MTDLAAARKALETSDRYPYSKDGWKPGMVGYIKLELRHVDAILAALAEREGFVLVPRTLTKEMEDAGYRLYCETDRQGYVAWRNVKECFVVMLAAAPQKE